MQASRALQLGYRLSTRLPLTLATLSGASSTTSIKSIRFSSNFNVSDLDDFTSERRSSSNPYSNRPNTNYARFKKPRGANFVPGLIAAETWLSERQCPEWLEEKLFSQSKFGTEEWSRVCDVPVKVAGFPLTEKGYAPEYMESFADMPHLDPRIQRNLERMKLTRPSAVQKYALTILQDGYDLLGVSQTGSGKTVAFLTPMIHNIVSRYPTEAMSQLTSERGQVQYPLGLVLAPTQELARQIHEEALKITYGTYARPVALYGGENIMRQIQKLEEGCHLAVATPGRLTDLLKRGHLSLKFCKSVVLDEGDRMLDMGFEPQIREILETASFGMPAIPDRQTSMFSATFSPEVRDLALNLVRRKEALYMAVGDVGSMPKNINHSFITLDNPSDVLPKLIETVKKIDDGSRILVFCNMKREADLVDKQLYRSNHKSAAIHGDKSRNERNMAIDLFKENKANILVATSVASRGLDLPSVKHVVNLHMPVTMDDYVHRAGRTGRMGREGSCISIVTPHTISRSVASELTKILREAEQPIPDFLASVSGPERDGYSQRDGQRRSWGQRTGQNNFSRPRSELQNRYASDSPSGGRRQY